MTDSIQIATVFLVRCSILTGENLFLAWGDEYFLKLGKAMTVSIIFTPKPEKWGLRGDPFLWDALKTSFSTVPLPCEEERFLDHFEHLFRKLTNHPFEGEDEVFVPKFAEDGMSSGQVSLKFWEDEALPLLLKRLEKAQTD